MTLLFSGIHQRTAPMALRERLAFSPADLPAALAQLHTITREGFLLSTCNRVEIYAIVDDSPDAVTVLEHFLADWHGLDHRELAPFVTTCTDMDVARRLFRLASGLDSMVLGEDQIVGQLKDAIQSAQHAGALGPLLHHLVERALAAGKQVRTETGIARSRLSVVSVALDLARSAGWQPGEARVLVVGAGRMADLALKYLRAEGCTQIAVANRTLVRAEALAAHYGATAMPLESVETELLACDLAIFCTSAPDVVLSQAAAERIAAQRTQPLLLLDLAVPRDVERTVGEVAGIRLFDVDAMQPICNANRAARLAEMESAERLVERAVGEFQQWWEVQQVVPTIRALRELAESIRMHEIQRTLARHPDLSPREQRAMDVFSQALINKILHAPTMALKDPQSGGDLVGAVQRLFQL